MITEITIKRANDEKGRTLYFGKDEKEAFRMMTTIHEVIKYTIGENVNEEYTSGSNWYKETYYLGDEKVVELKKEEKR